MKKTITEWFAELPEDVRQKAMVNYEQRMMSIEDDKNIRMFKFSSLKMALSCAFLWCESPERHDYWEKICFNLEG